jgi:hypothetical protein
MSASSDEVSTAHDIHRLPLAPSSILKSEAIRRAAAS